MIDRVSETTVPQKLLDDIEHMRDTIAKSFERIDKRLEKLEAKLEERIQVNGRQNENITELHAKMDSLERGLASMQERFADMEERITAITKGLVDTVKATTVRAWAILAGLAGAIGTIIYVVERLISKLERKACKQGVSKEGCLCIVSPMCRRN